ncbi:hypothetical protein GH714_030262 [Hevea brasiliensis]|uniref:Uncharacterized protein n=1 Tax=Hevea brasiliensis TaxID=3981 RepID=A0A6A6N3E3_HEVBR|nr:hypothetical protein GH714_030262 [Hevea brasiliensis]
MNRYAGKAVSSAAKAAVAGHPHRSRRPQSVHLPPYSSHGSVVNAQMKSKVTPSSSSQLGKFLGFVDPPRSEISKIISRFIKLHMRQNPGLKKNRNFEEKLMSLLALQQRIGLQEHWSSNGYRQLIFFSSAPQNFVVVLPNFGMLCNITPLIAQNQSQTLPDKVLSLAPLPLLTTGQSLPIDQYLQSDTNWKFGIIDNDGRLSNDFEVGEFNPEVVDNWGNETRVESGEKDIRVRVKRFELCSEREYMLCLDNVDAIKRLKSTESGEKYERHCPKEGKGLNCLVLLPKGYQ